jgi:hypothetical protein
VPTGGGASYGGFWRTAAGYIEGSFASFSSSELKGADLSGVFGVSGNCWYPAAGYIDGSSNHASLVNVGESGYLSSCTRKDYVLYVFYIYQSGNFITHTTDGVYRANGYPVRCMKEE